MENFKKIQKLLNVETHYNHSHNEMDNILEMIDEFTHQLEKYHFLISVPKYIIRRMMRGRFKLIIFNLISENFEKIYTISSNEDINNMRNDISLIYEKYEVYKKAEEEFIKSFTK